MEISIAEILSSEWLINENFVRQYVPIFLHYVNGGIIDIKMEEKEKELPFVFSKAGDIVTPDNLYSNVKENSVLAIPINGSIIARDSQNIENIIKFANNNPKIISMLLLMNTPGGMVYYTDILSNTIKNSEKPILSYVRNMTASAGMWIASATKKIMVSSKMDQLGSIGTMTSFLDYSGLFEKFGIKKVDIYAPESPNKNDSIRVFMDSGDKKLIEDRLSYITNIFHETISSNLGIDKNDPKNDRVFGGSIFSAEEAINLGLAHQITSLNDAFQQTYKAGVAYIIKSSINKNK